MERMTNEHLAYLTQKYGYHFVFRVSPQMYYMIRTVAEEIDFWGHNPRGTEERIRTQSICYEAFEHQLRLHDVEKRILVNITNCSARDAMVFCTCFPPPVFFFFFFSSKLTSF
ncbi:putative mating locus protein [Aspergillus chevalieri]|uniref:Uncharacterized protein n=1 Tax=Aspergillus chevalieri TaxID=182096 RepID=A0A7R7VVM1_ASPCH|nr:uncharacterized protein ACHE_70470S [Aspergillus chevalieri]BCR91627.1 hypothetical protein ACHE_70470S [Aspergillus chevalieri]